MLRLKEILLISIITILRVSSKEECEETELVFSDCFSHAHYQWLIEVPKSKTSCKGQTLNPPLAVPCGLACAPGETLDKTTLECKACGVGTFSLGGGYQYTFNELDDLKLTIPKLSFKSTSLAGLNDKDCKKMKVWQVKGNMLQGDVQHNCAISLSLPFKLDKSGSIKITYNLPTSYVFGTISSRCGFTIADNDNDNNDDNDDDQSDLKRNIDVRLSPTGYGVWTTEQIKIDTAGEYILQLYTFGVNAFHFPFSIRSFIIEGTYSFQGCIRCPPGTFSNKKNSSVCTPCPKDTYTEHHGSTKCESCDKNQYADEGSSKCTDRPLCEAKHYQKVFVGCETSNMATIEYRPIQPKICIDGNPPTEKITIPCGTCNPGMFKNQGTGKCEFCPPNTYSNGASNQCLPCAHDLSLVPGLYYKIWNDLPMFLNRTYMAFQDNNADNDLLHNQSWIPSIEYISAKAIPDLGSVLSLTIAKGFATTDIATATKEYGTLYFQFSIQCTSSCTLYLISEDMYDDDDDSWQVIHKWHNTTKSEHNNILEYKYIISYPNEMVFNWLFKSEDDDQGTDEVRIYEIRVTNTQIGGSDRCVACLTTDNQETKCQACAPGHILSNSSCIACPNSTIASRVRSYDPVPTVCKPCPDNTRSDDGILCYVPCKQAFHSDIEYDLNKISTMEFHGSKLFTQKGSGYFHVFNASICGKTSVTCAKTSTFDESKRRRNQIITDSKLCRMGSVPDQNENVTSVAYIDNFGEELINISLSTSKYFPAFRSDYNLTDITLVYRANTSAIESTCFQRTTFLSLRCDHLLDDEKQNSIMNYKLQTPADCSSGTCDGCTFHFLLRTPFACPTCDENTNGFRTFVGACKFGRQEVRKIPYPYCSHILNEKVETRRCSILSLEIKIIIILFLIIATILILVVMMCWRKNRKLEYRYMQLVENANPDDDTPVDNVCAQISDEEESGDEVQFKKPSKAKKIMNVVRNAIRKNPNNEQSDFFSGDSFLLTSPSTNQT